jgi:hypothetical protein
MPREADFYTPGEAASLLGLTEFTVLGLLTSGQLKGRQDDQARWWIPAAAVDEAVRRSRDADPLADPSDEETISMPPVSPGPHGSEDTSGSEDTTTSNADPEDVAQWIEATDMRRTEATEIGGQSDRGSGWVATDVAAKSLAVSPRSVRRFIDRGELEGRKVEEGIVTAWEVSIDSLYALRDKRKAKGQGEGQVRRRVPRMSGEQEETTDTSDIILRLTSELVRHSSELGELRARLELTAKAESSLREERDQARAEAEKFRAELEAERSKGFWRRLFGG